MFQKFPYDTIREVTIPDENGSGIRFVVATKQLEHLASLTHEITSTPPSWGEGVDSAAIVGMNLIFESIPQKFPVQNLLNWLRDSIDPKIPATIVEAALIQLARLYVV